MKINNRSYVFLKYLATLGLNLIFTAMLICFLHYQKNIIADLTTLKITTITLASSGLLAFMIFILIRINLKKKSPYTYTKKESTYLYTAFILYLFVVILGFSYLLVSFQQAHLILFIICIILALIATIIGAILETLSRIREQILLNKLKYEHEQKALKQEINSINLQEDEMIDEKVIIKQIKKNRTAQAQALLSDDAEKIIKIKPSQVSNQPTVIDEYNPFMDQKLNEQLQENEEFKKWLENEK